MKKYVMIYRLDRFVEAAKTFATSGFIPTMSPLLSARPEFLSDIAPSTQSEKACPITVANTEFIHYLGNLGQSHLSGRYLSTSGFRCDCSSTRSTDKLLYWGIEMNLTLSHLMTNNLEECDQSYQISTYISALHL